MTREVVTASEPRLLAADSFRVRVDHGNAQVRGFRRHLERFRAAVHDALGDQPHTCAPHCTPTSATVDAFLTRSAGQITAYGEGNPRVEFWACGSRSHSGSVTTSARSRLQLSLRPLPELRDEIALVTAPNVALQHAHRKGPNLFRLIALNTEFGAEALLTCEDGTVSEGATTSIVWWQDGVLHAVAGPADQRRRVASVTESLVVESATQLGFRAARSSITAHDLGRHEVWALNALHGIRPVTHLDGAPASKPDAARLAAFRSALDETWSNVS